MEENKVVTPEVTNRDGKKISSEDVKNATEILRKYRDGKSALEDRIRANEEWWRLRHWDYINKRSSLESTSAWLFNSVANKHADAMDSYPSPNILPREQDDVAEAKMLSDIVPVILEENGFEKVYSDCWWTKLKSGTAVYGIFWNSKKLNGIGDIDIQKVDLLNIFWEPGITDIQKSRNVFTVDFIDNDILVQTYPQLKNKLSGTDISITRYDKSDKNEESMVVDWYYKKHLDDGRTVLHYVKFCGDEVLFASENEAGYENGWYEHGEYPFVFDVMYPVETSPAGFGTIDVCKDPQTFIDKLNSSILKNALVNATPRFMTTIDSGINEEEFLNPDKPLIKVGTLSETQIMPMITNQLNGNYLAVLTSKIDELKETSGNRDVSNGGTTGGATAAAAIAAMQEAGSKLTRDQNKQSYRVYAEIVALVIELIRQFYDSTRTFRITGNAGEQEFVEYSNANLKPMSQGGIEYEVDTGYRKPVFDIKITAEKASPYTKLSQNEMALQFYQAGFFNPQLADQALLCLDMMDFDRKDDIIQKIQNNGGMYQQMMQMQMQMQQMAAVIDEITGRNSAPIEQQNDVALPPQTDISDNSGDESAVTRKARERVANG